MMTAASGVGGLSRQPGTLMNRSSFALLARNEQGSQIGVTGLRVKEKNREH